MSLKTSSFCCTPKKFLTPLNKGYPGRALYPRVGTGLRDLLWAEAALGSPEPSSPTRSKWKLTMARCNHKVVIDAHHMRPLSAVSDSWICICGAQVGCSITVDISAIQEGFFVPRDLHEYRART